MGLLSRGTPCAALPLRAPPSFPRFRHACKRARGGGGAPKWRGETCILGGGACLQTGWGGRGVWEGGGGGGSWVRGRGGGGGVWSALPPAWVQRGWRACRRGGVQPR